MIYLIFSFRGPSVSGKTYVWEVCNSKREGLGYIQWSGPWRKYVFRTAADCDFDGNCLREIIEFCESRTKEHKEKI